MRQQYISFRIMATAVFIIAAFSGCKKVVNDQKRLSEQPSLVTGHATLVGTGLGNIQDRYDYVYKTQFQVGDTMVLAGRLFPASVEIRIGDVIGKVVYTKKISIYGTPEIPVVDGDFIKLLITKEMGAGSNRPVQITANGQTILAPAIAIVDLPPFTGQTDTTLRVDSLLAFVQDGLRRFDFSHITDGNVGHSGQICFSNSRAAYLLLPGATAPQQLVAVKTEYGTGNDIFKFNYLKAAAISWDEKSLYVSGEVSDNGPNNPDPDARRYGVVRLVKIDLHTHEMTTVNRSFFGGFGNNPSRIYDVPGPGLITGPLSQVNLVIDKIHPDAYNNLYVENTVYITANNVVSIGSNISVNGQVKTAFSNDSRYPGQYASTPDGVTFNPITLLGFTGIKGDRITSNISYYDFRREEPLLSFTGSNKSFTYSYFDSSVITGYAHNKKSEAISLDYEVAFNARNTVVLSTGEMVLFHSVLSPTSFNITKNVAYMYAGCEINTINHTAEPPLLSSLPADISGVQANTTGLAKYVNFYDAKILGVDEKNTIYFFRPATGGPTTPPPGNTARIYKLYKP